MLIQWRTSRAETRCCADVHTRLPCSCARGAPRAEGGGLGDASGLGSGARHGVGARRGECSSTAGLRLGAGRSALSAPSPSVGSDARLLSSGIGCVSPKVRLCRALSTSRQSSSSASARAQSSEVLAVLATSQSRSAILRLRQPISECKLPMIAFCSRLSRLCRSIWRCMSSITRDRAVKFGWASPSMGAGASDSAVRHPTHIPKSIKFDWPSPPRGTAASDSALRHPTQVLDTCPIPCAGAGDCCPVQHYHPQGPQGRLSWAPRACELRA
mmetsp:Transcript_73245/g.196576  ORF Transcript_73245/g.196576 Transcript_73245/m.196576 type:complete len:271 (+) Transcript_73245:258-1070(+)